MRRKRHKRHGPPFLFILLLVLVMAGVVGVAGIVIKTASAGAVTPVEGLHVSGNQLVNANGNVFRPVGVDRSGAEYECDTPKNVKVFDGPTDSTAINSMLSWDITSVRLPLNEDCWLGINGYPAASYSAAWYRRSVSDFVNALTARNLAVILDLHWNSAATQQAKGEQPMPDRDHAPAFWTSVANTFKGTSSVIFDLYNEPYTTSWACWKNGSTAAYARPCTDVGFAVAGMQTLVNSVRATGATNPILLGGLAYANDLSQWLQYEPTDAAHNLLASAHIYNFDACNTPGCWASGIGAVAAKVPVIADEIGENDCAGGFITTAMKWLDQQNIGYLAWAWDTYDCRQFPALINNYSGAATAYGDGFRRHLKSLALRPDPITQLPVTTPSVMITFKCLHHQSTFTGGITIANASTTSYSGWKVQFTFTGAAKITKIPNGNYTQNGTMITITNTAADADLAGGQSLELTFQGTSAGGGSSVAAAFLFNGASLPQGNRAYPC